MAAIGGSQDFPRKIAARLTREQAAAAITNRQFAGNLLGERHESRRQGNAQHLAGAGRLVGRRDRSDGAAASLRHRAPRHARGSGARHPRHGDPRRAADRRDRRLWHLPGAARRRLRRSARSGLCDAARHAPDRDQSQMGARRDDGRGPQPAARRAHRRRLSARRRDLRRGRRHQHRDRPQRPAAHRSDRRAQEAGRAGQRIDPLQRRLAGGGRRRHGDGADLSGARQGHRRFTSSPTKPGRAIRAPR